ncbi:MAG: 4-hydroxythreonine-4-phosphate dehydrogenase PdxA [Firmicutes bacterium]|jgi:4-hydroxythreonine-4-phosphate dehydrogenase|nr:4-hydroxythreonine-4-phosphate dehydrogenase PdxA [Bacillota bacterium]MDH7494757.1 4-hydroxythreonine-4-phosphate dehydrogenase PdxA [Bacillota bacterium]
MLTGDGSGGLDTKLPMIAITMGDPAGIGAEIAVKALECPELHATSRPIIVGDARVVGDAIRFTGSKLEMRRISDIREAKFGQSSANVLDLANVDMRSHAYGRVSSDAGRAAFEYIRCAIELAMAGTVDAVVTGPIHKEALNLAGYHYSGHTEIFADLTGAKDYAMMLVDRGMRVVHVTTHVSLRKACDLVKKERVLVVIKLADKAARALGMASPRIGVAGLNPHAGEGGLFGTEEIEEIGPAVQEARALQINVEGPIPPDTLFAKARGGQYDVAVAMYHDQGHIPLKTVGFELDGVTGRWAAVSGVNVTLGLPIIRTSVDHGTAFGKAGKGTANPESMIQAIRLAARFAAGRIG